MVCSCRRVTWSLDPVCGWPLTCESTSRDSVTPLRMFAALFFPPFLFSFPLPFPSHFLLSSSFPFPFLLFRTHRPFDSEDDTRMNEWTLITTDESFIRSYSFKIVDDNDDKRTQELSQRALTNTSSVVAVVGISGVASVRVAPWFARLQKACETILWTDYSKRQQPTRHLIPGACRNYQKRLFCVLTIHVRSGDMKPFRYHWYATALK